MKKLIPTLALIMLLTACDNKSASNASGSSELVSNDNNSGNSGTPIGGDIIHTQNKVDIKIATENYKADFEKCKAGSYPNLNWDNATAFPVATIEDCCNLMKSAPNQGKQLTAKEKVENLKKYCNFFFGEYDEEWSGFTTLDEVDFEDTRTDLKVDGINYTIFEKISDHIKEIENEDFELNWFVYINPYKRQHLWWSPLNMKYPFWINKGRAAEILKTSQNKYVNVQSGLPEHWGEPVARYVNDGTNNNVTYKLADGECSIGEAIEYFTTDYWKSLPFDEEDKQPFLVRYIDVFKMTEDTYAYFIRFSVTYNSLIPFEISEDKAGTNLPNYYSEYSQALMVKKDDIDVVHTLVPIADFQETDEHIAEIISIKDAADIVSKQLTQSVKFDVVSTDFVYHGLNDPNTGNALLKPTWIFVLHNSNDENYYNAYVDAVTGDFNYYMYTT